MSYASELGERKIIEIIINALEKMPDMPVPFGDDVSAVDIGGGKLAVLKCDMLVRETDVPPGMTLWQASRKAVVMNVSDLAAKGVQPKAALVSLGLPSNFKEEDIKLIGLGLNAGAREYGAYVIGGDTNEAKDLVIDCLLFGLIDKGKLIGRSGAKPSDILAVTGPFGKTAAGLKAIVENLKAPEEIKGKLLEAVYMPKAKLREGLTLADANLASASIDSSDGLAWSLHEISRMSGVGFIVDNLPIAPEALKFVELNELDPFELAFYGGEEYELVVTIRPEKWGQAVEKIKSIGGQLIKIGVATEKRELVLKTREEVRKIEPRGWQHFIRF